MSASESIQDLLHRAWDHRLRSEFQAAYECLEKARALCHIEDYSFLGRIAHIDRQIAADQDKWELAASYGWKAIEYYKSAGDALKIAHAYRHQADIMRHMDCGIEAHALYKKALDIYRENELVAANDMANALRGYALNLYDMGRKDQAKMIWQEAADLYASIGLLDGMEEAKSWLDQLK